MILRIISCMILVIGIEESLAANICSKGTDKTVKMCPINERMWIEASKRKNCTQFMTKDCIDLQYHCVLNAYGNGTVEVCAKLTYLQGFCAEYNPLTNSVQNHHLLRCMNFTNGRCPSRYRSTEAYKYQECFKLLKGPNLNSNRTSDNPHPPQEQGSNGIAVVIAMIMILFVLPICVFVGFMIYHVNYHHRSINEALGKLPFCGSRISKLNCFSSTQNKDQVDAKTPEQMKLLEGQSERKDQEDEQRKAMFSEISKLKDVFVTEEEKLISEEEVKILAPKLQVLVERLEKLRPVSVPEIILINLKKINSLLHALSPHKPTKTIASKYVKKVTDFTKTLEQIEEEVQKEFQKLAEVVQIKDVYLTVHKEWSFGERVNDFERKITKLEEMNESNC